MYNDLADLALLWSKLADFGQFSDPNALSRLSGLKGNYFC